MILSRDPARSERSGFFAPSIVAGEAKRGWVTAIAKMGYDNYKDGHGDGGVRTGRPYRCFPNNTAKNL